MWSAFADKEEKPELPGSNWDLTFNEQNGVTNVRMTITNESHERFDNMIEMGFQGGFTMTLNYLEKLLIVLSEK